MPKEEFDHEDPMELVSFAMPEEDAELRGEMARCLAEEYIRIGASDDDLMKMFRNPFYSVPHEVYRCLGEEAVRDLIAKARAGWGPASE